MTIYKMKDKKLKLIMREAIQERDEERSTAIRIYIDEFVGPFLMLSAWTVILVLSAYIALFHLDQVNRIMAFGIGAGIVFWIDDLSMLLEYRKKVNGGKHGRRKD